MNQLILQTEGGSASSQPKSMPARGGYTRQRQGCLTCRRRKKRCDRRYPLCGHCSRLNLACEREEPRRVVQASDQTASNAGQYGQVVITRSSEQSDVARIYSAVDESVLRSSTYDCDLSKSRRIILRYYTSVFANMLSTNHENNCFLSVMVPMAFECAPLMRSLVAWAAAHLAARQTSFQQIALRHRGSALNAIKTSLDEGDLSSEMCLAVAMVLCSMESISNKEGLWYQHLIGGAAALGLPAQVDSNDTTIDSRELPLASETIVRLTAVEGGWLLRNFAYHDVLMSITLDRAPLLSGNYWEELYTGESRKADPYFGLASDIIYLTSRVSELNAELAAYSNGNPPPLRTVAFINSSGHEILFHRCLQATSTSNILSDAWNIESELLAWSCKPDQSQKSLQLLAESYRSAALLHLYRTLRRYDKIPADEVATKISHQVSNICDLVTEMPEGCLAECTLLFPLFMAGGEAEKPQHVQTIREKLVVINQWRHFRNVDHALETLDELWRLRATDTFGPEGEKLDWLDITKANGTLLSIS